MARYDKYEPLTGGHRAPLAADWLSADLNKVVPVSLNASGQVVKGYTAGKMIGVVCITGKQNSLGQWIGLPRAGSIVDVMQDGEIVELTGLVAGTKYWGALDGNSLTATQAAGLAMVGWTVEAGRLIVRCQTAPNSL